MEKSSVELKNKKNSGKVISILHSSEQQPFEERLRVAHKDISRINFEESDGSEEEVDKENEIQVFYFLHIVGCISEYFFRIVGVLRILL